MQPASIQVTAAEAKTAQIAVRLPTQPVPGWRNLAVDKSVTPNVLDAAGAILTRSARSALALALRCAGIGAGDVVLVPNYYCPTMPAPVEQAGAGVLFYPIRRDASPDVDWIRAHINPSCKGVLGAHFFGRGVSFSPLRELCDEKGLTFIEDCAHAFFGHIDGKPLGSFGHYAIASLPKFFPVVEGGVLASRERSLENIELPELGALAQVKAAWNLLELGARYGRLRGLNTAVRATSSLLANLRRRNASPVAAADGETADAVRRDALADPLLLPAQLRSAERWIFSRVARERTVVARRSNYARLCERLLGHEGLVPLFPELRPGDVPYVCAVWVDAPDPAYGNLRACGVPVLRWNRYWPTAIETPSDVGRSFGHHVFQMLCHQDLASDDIETIATKLLATVRASPS